VSTGSNGAWTACKDGFLKFTMKLDVCAGKLADDAFAKALAVEKRSSPGQSGERKTHEINTVRSRNLH
jgi:hypothetical protein